MIFAFLDPKINIQPGIIWIVGVGVVSILGTIIGVTTKVLTRNHIHRNEAYKSFQTTKFCEERSSNIEEKIDDLKENMNLRFDDLKDLINKNSKGVS